MRRVWIFLIVALFATVPSSAAAPGVVPFGEQAAAPACSSSASAPEATSALVLEEPTAFCDFFACIDDCAQDFEVCEETCATPQCTFRCMMDRMECEEVCHLECDD